MRPSSAWSSTPDAFRRADGSSFFRPEHATVFSSSSVLDAEDRLLRLADTRTAAALDLDTVADAITHQDGGLVFSASQ